MRCRQCNFTYVIHLQAMQMQSCWLHLKTKDWICLFIEQSHSHAKSCHPAPAKEPKKNNLAEDLFISTERKMMLTMNLMTNMLNNVASWCPQLKTRSTVSWGVHLNMQTAVQTLFVFQMVIRNVLKMLSSVCNFKPSFIRMCTHLHTHLYKDIISTGSYRL